MVSDPVRDGYRVTPRFGVSPIGVGFDLRSSKVSVVESAEVRSGDHGAETILDRSGLGCVSLDVQVTVGFVVVVGELAKDLHQVAFAEGEHWGEPGHVAILTEDSACAKLLPVAPLSCGFEAAGGVFSRHILLFES
jgi:hypothetical protein